MPEMAALWHHRHNIPRSELTETDRALVYPDTERSQLELTLALLGHAPALDLYGRKHKVCETVGGCTARDLLADKRSDGVHALLREGNG
jgi:hypothetical protein